MKKIFGCLLIFLLGVFPAAHADSGASSWSESSPLSPGTGPGPTSGGPAGNGPMSSPQGGPAGETETPSADLAISRGSQDIRDPFQMAAPQTQQGPVSQGSGPAAPTVKAVLQGIGRDAKDSLAIINGEVYYEGQVKGGIKVVQIGKKGVDIETGGIAQKLVMLPKEELDSTLERIKKKTTREEDKTTPKAAAPGLGTDSSSMSSGLPQDGSSGSYE